MTSTGATIVYDALEEAGIDLLIGLPGTQTIPLDRIVAERDEMRYVMARHETAIPHVAWGYYESGGGIAATLTVPGPGETNAMHGLKNALDDCVPLIHISADVNPEDRGYGPIHEIESNTYDNVVKENINVPDKESLADALRDGISAARRPPTGPVRLGIPSTLLRAEIPSAGRTDSEADSHSETGAVPGRALEILAEAQRPVLYVGGGARRSPAGSETVAALADVLNCPVISSYKGKGVFPEDDSRFVGVTAGHLPAGGKRVLEEADVVLALGTDFDGVTTGHWELPMGDRLLHVTLEPDAPTAYDVDVTIAGDVSAVGTAILEQLNRPDTESWNGEHIGQAVRSEYFDHLRDLGLLDPHDAPAHLPAVYDRLRATLPREAIISTDIGGHRLWAKQTFEAYDRNRYITAGSWAGMGVGLPSAIGAKLAHPDKPVVTLTGDGSLMMCIHELHTAAEHDVNVVVVVLNDADYGIISDQPEIADVAEGRRFSWTSPDFAMIAEGFGCHGTRVDTAVDAAEAVENALQSKRGPELIDVVIDYDDPSVFEAAEYDSTVPF